MLISLNEIIDFLYNSVASSNIKILTEHCYRLGMKQIPYVSFGLDSNLPEYDNGFRYQFETEDHIPVTLDVLEKMGMILQIGIQLYYKPLLFFSKVKKHYTLLSKKLYNIYGHAHPSSLGMIDILNYQDNNTVCYITKTKVNEIEAITVRFGNRDFWG